MCCGYQRKERCSWRKNVQMAKATFANAQMGVGRGDTQQATTLKQENASSKMCWVRHTGGMQGETKRKPLRKQNWISAAQMNIRLPHGCGHGLNCMPNRISAHPPHELPPEHQNAYHPCYQGYPSLNKLTTRDLQKLYNDLQKQWAAEKSTEKEKTRPEQFHCARHSHDAAQCP